jgi:Holliday junction resolvase RusA-like endonuclease
MSNIDVEFVVQGTPVPQGSTKSFYLKKLERVVTTHVNASELRDWRFAIKLQAEKAMQANHYIMSDEKDSAYAVTMSFFFLKPKSIKHNSKNTKPDLDKLIRSVLDALTGTCFINDSRVIMTHASKEFSHNGREYAIIKVHSIKTGEEKNTELRA